jgi:hypothetical protein
MRASPLEAVNFSKGIRRKFMIIIDNVAVTDRGLPSGRSIHRPRIDLYYPCEREDGDTILALPENRALTVVAREHLAPGDISIAAQVAHVKASNAQVVLVLCIGSPFGTVLRDLHDAGVAVPVAVQ